MAGWTVEAPDGIPYAVWEDYTREQAAEEERCKRSGEPTWAQRGTLRRLVDNHFGGDWHAMWAEYPQYDPYGFTGAEADTLIHAIRSEYQQKLLPS